jgi:hypothetical protein
VTVPPALELLAPLNVAWSVTVVSLGTVMVGPFLPPPDSEAVKVVGAWLEPVVVVVVPPPPPPDNAMIGEIELAVGAVEVMPDGVTESLGYAVQVSARGLPATVRLRLALASSEIAIGPPVAVNPLTVAGVEGSDKATPSSGTGLGIVTSKVSGP